MKYLNKLFAWMGSDGMQHVILSATLATLIGLMMPWWLTAPIVLGIGIGKEVYDKVSKKGWAEWKDIICDLIGIIIGVL